ncbi:MAG: Oxidoreductase [Microbacteriaceae bacterium]|nr:Oxidoreductase [Microbacteriaceae bacterium]
MPNIVSQTIALRPRDFAWLGHAIATSAADDGHHVTCLARGAGVPGGTTPVRADRDFEDSLDAVATELRPALRGATSEDQMHNSRRRRRRFDVEAFLESFEPIPQPFAPAQHNRHEHDVHVINQVGL